MGLLSRGRYCCETYIFTRIQYALINATVLWIGIDKITKKIRGS
jgi:hypothetical protein